MEITIQALEDNKIEVTAELDAKEVDEKVGRTYKDFARKYNFPGFRKGKAPRPVIDNAFGREAILASATEDAINGAYPVIIEDERISPVGSPDFADTGMMEPGKAFTFKFTLEVTPQCELTSYDPIEIELPTDHATEEEVDEQIDMLLKHYETYENASAATKLKKENSADLDIQAKKENGESVDGLTNDAAFYMPGSGIYSEAFDKEIEGIKKGETREFTLEIPADEAALLLADVAGQNITFTVTCNVVKKNVTPTLTDEWVKDTLGLDDIAALKEEITQSITQQKQQIIPQIKENECAQVLVDRFEGEAPAALVEQNESNLIQDFFTQLQRQGATFDAYLAQRGIDSDQFKEDVKKQAADETKQQLALDAWARHFNLEATDEDVSLEFVRAGVDDPKALEEEWRATGRLHLIREGIVRAKAMENVLDTAKVTEVSPEAFAKKK